MYGAPPSSSAPQRSGRSFLSPPLPAPLTITPPSTSTGNKRSKARSRNRKPPDLGRRDSRKYIEDRDGWKWVVVLVRPVMAWNHNQVMSAGERGLAVWLKDPAHAAVVPAKVE